MSNPEDAAKAPFWNYYRCLSCGRRLQAEARDPAAALPPQMLMRPCFERIECQGTMAITGSHKRGPDGRPVGGLIPAP